MRGLHRARNAVQPQGDIPSMDSVTKYRSYAEDFLKVICRDVFSVPYEELYLSALVEKESLRKQILKAEEAFGRGEFRLCIELCDDAFMSATFDEADVFSDRGDANGILGSF